MRAALQKRFSTPRWFSSLRTKPTSPAPAPAPEPASASAPATPTTTPAQATATATTMAEGPVVVSPVALTTHATLNVYTRTQVTGASGFLGSHIITQLLAQGTSVRALVRPTKAEFIKTVFPTDAVTVATMTDISTDDLSAAFAGASAIINCASPLAMRGTPQETVDANVDGMVNVLRGALKAGVSKVVITSSWATTINPDLSQQYTGQSFGQDSWGEVTSEQILDGTRNPVYVYLGAKIIGEKAAWEFVEEHPELDLTTINPPFLMGPYIPGVVPSGPTDIGTNRFLYRLIAGPPGRTLPPLLSPHYLDVRDCARAHIAALSTPKAPPGSQRTKRFLVIAGAVTWRTVTEWLYETRPELRERLPDVSGGIYLPETMSENDVGPAERALGMREYIHWKKMVQDGVDDFLVLHEKWMKEADGVSKI
ncbi:hypothetical protein M0805_006787 [Coniferiporia weirii]|nr:hypothetical protein M0805_006787 [Coniferiporia weirii]